MKQLIQLLSTVVLLLISHNISATAMCKTSEVHLESMQLLSGGPILDLSQAPFPYGPLGREATSCIGLLSGNDKAQPSINIGQYGDGLLNGEVPKGSASGKLSPKNTLFDPFYLDGSNDANNDGVNDDLAFILPSDLQDLDGVGGLNDPGWVYLGKDDGEPAGFETATAGVGLPGQIAISDILNVNFTCSVGVINADEDKGEKNCTSGSWVVEPLAGIEDKLKPLFGEGFFDHLAFVFKAGNNFAIYDFNFNTIKNELGGGIDLTVPYILSGSFDLGNLQSNPFEGKGISHVSLWARDPSLESNINRIPEPGIALLMLFGVMLVLARMKKNATFL